MKPKKKRRRLKKIDQASQEVAAYLAMEYATPFPTEDELFALLCAWSKLTSEDKAGAEQRFLRKQPNADKPRY